MNNTAQNPNILLIIMDSVRADHLSSYGYDRVTTPNLDQFRKQATLYRQAFSNSSWSLPSHASLFTGLYPANHGLFDHNHKLAESEITLPELLNQEGYFTGGVTSNPWIEQGGLDRGFESVKEIGGRDKKQSRSILEKSGFAKLLGKLKRALFFTGRETKEAMESIKGLLLEQGTKKPAFLFANFMEAHHPYLPPRPFHSKFSSSPLRSYLKVKDLAESTYGKDKVDDALFQEAIDLYDAEIAYLDDSLGKFFEWLQSEGLFENSMIILTSDHGEQFGEHELCGKRLMGHEFSVYDTLLHVPLLVKNPGQSRGQIVNEPVELVDLLPTITQKLSGINLEPRQLDGDILEKKDNKSFLRAEYRTAQIQLDKLNRLFDKGSDDGDPEDFDVRLQSIRENEFKLIFDRSSGSTELYNTKEDPLEQRNIAEKMPEKVSKLKAELSSPSWLKDDVEGDQFEDQDGVRNRLKDLGYL